MCVCHVCQFTNIFVICTCLHCILISFDCMIGSDVSLRCTYFVSFVCVALCLRVMFVCIACILEQWVCLCCISLHWLVYLLCMIAFWVCVFYLCSILYQCSTWVFAECPLVWHVSLSARTLEGRRNHKVNVIRNRRRVGHRRGPRLMKRSMATRQVDGTSVSIFVL